MSLRLPRLDEEVLSDHDALGNAIDKVLLKTKVFVRLSNKIRRRQRELRRLVDEPGWHAYLRVEEATNERAIEESELLVRWAFTLGRRAARRRRKEP